MRELGEQHRVAAGVWREGREQLVGRNKLLGGRNRDLEREVGRLAGDN